MDTCALPISSNGPDNAYPNLLRIYRPRNGRDISMFQMISALREVYNLSFPLAAFLTIVGIFVCGQWWSFPWKLDLHDLARHNRIEHNFSLCHNDAKLGHVYAPNQASSMLLKRLLTITKGNDFTLNNFVDARLRRAWDPEYIKPLDRVHREIAHGEVALTMLTMGERPTPQSADATITVPRPFIQAWFGGSRLPEGWKRPEQQIGLWQAKQLSGSIGRVIRARLERIALSA